jgi:hypothetical protein
VNTGPAACFYYCQENNGLEINLLIDTRKKSFRLKSKIQRPFLIPWEKILSTGIRFPVIPRECYCIMENWNLLVPIKWVYLIGGITP